MELLPVNQHLLFIMSYIANSDFERLYAEILPFENKSTNASDWREQVARSRQKTTHSYAGQDIVPVEPEVVTLLVHWAGLKYHTSHEALREKVGRRTGRWLSRGTISSILNKHGVVRRREASQMTVLERKILEGSDVGPRLRVRALNLNPALREHDGPGEGKMPGEVLMQAMFLVDPSPVPSRETWQVHAVVDTFGMMAFAMLCRDAKTESAVDLLHTRVLPWYAQQGVNIRRIETSRSRAYSDESGAGHVYTTYLKINDISQRVREPAEPSLNGYMLKFKQIITNEWLLPLRAKRRNLALNAGVPGQTSLMDKPVFQFDQMSAELDRWVERYNREYSVQGYRNEGLAPLDFWLRGRRRTGAEPGD